MNTLIPKCCFHRKKWLVKKSYFSAITMTLLLTGLGHTSLAALPDTGQTGCYDTSGNAMTCPSSGASLYGQDGNYTTNAPSYTNNGDGTITDNITGLMWQQDPDRNGDGNIDSQDLLSFANAKSGAASFALAGYNDWRLPTIKELYSLIDFSGATGTGTPTSTSVPADAVPYLNTNYFKFEYGDLSAGLRYIDAQYWSSTEYVSTTMAGINSVAGSATAFGVNFADGRIKGYGSDYKVINDARFVRYVRGGSNYGVNSFTDNGDNTITDSSTSLMWLKNDSGTFKPGSKGNGTVNWQEALEWCEGLSYAGYSDWLLPNAKELQSLVDYTRSPDTTASAAISSLFQSTAMTDEGGKTNYPFYWTSTSHRDGPDFAVYVAFGEALGCMAPQGSSTKVVTDVHGAGAQRSDPKTSSGTTIGCSNGPQGDVIRVYNYARCVRTAAQSNQSTIRLGGISTNALVSTTASDYMIAGVYITGGTKRLVVRGVSVDGGVINPRLTVQTYPNGTVIDTNDDWQKHASASEVQQAKYAPTYSTDAAMVISLNPGLYTFTVSPEGVKGKAIVEVYELEAGTTNKISGISTNAVVGTNAADYMIAGVYISGGSKKVKVRASSLDGILNPKLTVQSYPDGAVLYTNSSWQSDSSAAQVQQLNFAPNQTTDAAMVITLPQGLFTLTVSPEGAGGKGIIEVYEVN